MPKTLKKQKPKQIAWKNGGVEGEGEEKKTKQNQTQEKGGRKLFWKKKFLSL